MPSRINPINRRLKKSEVKDYINNQSAKLHEEYTKFFFEEYETGYKKEDLVYELPNGDFIYVFNPKGLVLPGKGNYYVRELFLRTIRWTQRVKEDYKFNRASSVDNWRFYSRQGSQLIKNGNENLETICSVLNIRRSELDFSYKSLGLIDTEIEKLPYGKVLEVLYDSLVYYVGEIIIMRVDGKWEIEEDGYKKDFPYVTVENTTIHYMPINIVFMELEAPDPCNLRKATADEIRTNAIWHPKNNKGNFNNPKLLF